MTIPSYTRNEFQEFAIKATSIDFPDLSDVLDWVKNNLHPEDVFSQTDLENWAEENDYRKPE